MDKTEIKNKLNKVNRKLIVLKVLFVIFIIASYYFIGSIGYSISEAKHKSDIEEIANIAKDAIELSQQGINSTQWCMDKLDTAISYRDGSVTLFLHDVKMSDEYEKVKRFLK